MAEGASASFLPSMTMIDDSLLPVLPLTAFGVVAIFGIWQPQMPGLPTSRVLYAKAFGSSL
ncbi:hypothetical protein D3C72_2202800 [compost metagenome]